MNYNDIVKVNSEMTMLPIEKRNAKTGEITKKDYAMVPERVTAFRKLYPEGFITTSIVSHESGTVLMQTTVGYYREDGSAVTLATGFAQEVRGQGLVNGTSYIENCETSAVGRALGMIGLGINGGGICSAEELANAITAQKQIKEAEKAQCQPDIPEGHQVSKASKLPAEAQPNPVANYIRNEIADIQDLIGAKTYAEARKTVFAWADELVKGGAMDPVDWINIDMDAAKSVFRAIRTTFHPGEVA